MSMAEKGLSIKEIQTPVENKSKIAQFKTGVRGAVQELISKAEIALVKLSPFSASTGQINEALEPLKGKPIVQRRARELGEKLNIVLLSTKDPGEIKSILEEMSAMKKRHPELSEFIDLKTREASGAVKVGDEDKDVTFLTEKKEAYPAQGLTDEEFLRTLKEDRYRRVQPGEILPQRDHQNGPAICLSDIGWYRENVKYPTRGEMLNVADDEGGSAEMYNPGYMDWRQASFAAIDLLNRGVLQRVTFAKVQQNIIHNYIDRVRVLTNGDERYKDLHNIAEAIFIAQGINYDTWRATEGSGKGAKAPGVGLMGGATDKISVGMFLKTVLQDPHIESALHRIRGNVDDEVFIKGRQRPELGDVYGGNLGAAEKVATYYKNFSGLEAIDDIPADQVASVSYTESVLKNPLEYYGRSNYQGFDIVIAGTHFDSGRTKRVIYTMDTFAPVSAFHDKNMVSSVHRNFTPERFGWKNIGRMLSILEIPHGQDQISTETIDQRSVLWRRKRDLEIKQSTSSLTTAEQTELFGLKGIYKLEEFLFASEVEQEEMARAAYGWYQAQAAITGGIDEQRRILNINLFRTYYWTERGVTDRPELNFGRWGVRKSLLSFREADGLGNSFVDIGSLDIDPRTLSNNFLNGYWVNMGYAYRDNDELINVFAQFNALSGSKKPEAVMKLATADLNRHLAENIEGSGEEVTGLGYIAKEKLMYFSRRLSHLYEISYWETRSHGRDKHHLAVTLNESLRNFFNAHIYRTEYESCGIDQVDWTNALANQEMLGYDARVAKILGKFERPDVWIEWLRDSGILEYVSRLVSDNPAEWAILTNDWRPLGINNYHEYLAYQALVVFAGYRIKEAYLEKDYYGYDVPRVKFELNFEKKKESRSHGQGFKDLLRGLSDSQKSDVWGRISYQINHKLNSPEYSPLYQFYEKMHEENFIDTLIEKYLQKTFDTKADNWYTNEWGQHLFHKKRWDTFALIKRQMKYTVGYLGEHDRFVHDQLVVRFKDQVYIDPNRRDKYKPNMIDKYGHPLLFDNNGNPLFEIVVDEKGLPDVNHFGDVGIKEDEGFDHVASFILGTEGLWRPNFYFKKVDVRHEHPIDLMSDPHDPGNKKEQDFRSYRGVGMAGEEKSISWMQIAYNKDVTLAHILREIFDPSYQYEVSLNGEENWEYDMNYLAIADLEQQRELLEKLKKLHIEDPGWVDKLLHNYGLDEENISRFRDYKAQLRVRDIQSGKLPESSSEEDIVSLAKRVYGVVGAAASILPIPHSITEWLAFAEGSAVAGVPATAVLITTGALVPIGGIFWIPIVLVGSAVVGAQFVDKGIDGTSGREKAAGLAKLIGGPNIPFTNIKWPAIGMYGRRLNHRRPEYMINGTSPVWDSALDIDALIKVIDKLRTDLKPAEEKPR